MSRFKPLAFVVTSSSWCGAFRRSFLCCLLIRWCSYFRRPQSSQRLTPKHKHDCVTQSIAYHNPKRKRAEHRGLILVFVLLMLAICGSVSAQHASKIIRLTSQVALAEQEMQSRWSVVSLRRALLENPESLFATNGVRQPGVKSVVRLRIRLSDKDFATQLEDESAKLPVQVLLKEGRPEQLRSVLRDLSGGIASLQPTLGKSASQWSQIFRLDEALSPRDSLSRMQQLASRMTLYSDGRLNIRYCDAETLDALWKYKLGIGAPPEIHDLRIHASVTDIRSLIAASGVSSAHAKTLEQYCSMTSNSHSLWIDRTNSTGFGFTAIYYKRTQAGFADEHFGSNSP
jgi:hypothetical protein